MIIAIKHPNMCERFSEAFIMLCWCSVLSIHCCAIDIAQCIIIIIYLYLTIAILLDLVYILLGPTGTTVE